VPESNPLLGLVGAAVFSALRLIGLIAPSGAATRATGDTGFDAQGTPFLYVAKAQEPSTLPGNLRARVGLTARAPLARAARSRQRRCGSADCRWGDLVAGARRQPRRLALPRRGDAGGGDRGSRLDPGGDWHLWSRVYSAVRRAREIGIGLAPGAAPRAIARLVIGGGASRVGAGVLVGLGAAALVTRALSRFFVLRRERRVNVRNRDRTAGRIALSACYLPARRAMKVNPIRALRHE
jgi:hypothetical protein